MITIDRIAKNLCGEKSLADFLGAVPMSYK